MRVSLTHKKLVMIYTGSAQYLITTNPPLTVYYSQFRAPMSSGRGTGMLSVQRYLMSKYFKFK